MPLRPRTQTQPRKLLPKLGREANPSDTHLVPAEGLQNLTHGRAGFVDSGQIDGHGSIPLGEHAQQNAAPSEEMAPASRLLSKQARDQQSLLRCFTRGSGDSDERNAEAVNTSTIRPVRRGTSGMTPKANGRTKQA